MHIYTTACIELGTGLVVFMAFGAVVFSVERPNTSRGPFHAASFSNCFHCIIFYCRSWVENTPGVFYALDNLVGFCVGVHGKIHAMHGSRGKTRIIHLLKAF